MNNIAKSILALLAAAAPAVAQAQTDTVPVDSLADIPTIELDDLVITANKTVIKSDGAKLTYNVAEDESSKGQSVLDALRKVPMVTVDAQDNIRINGQTGFKIYVNGREDTMLESNYQRLLKAMPAESVKNIEVITEPGAKYDAEGVGGILNLITETKTQRDGYSGSIGL
ncbi:MAG: Plug domain-containing protein, partial [Bacteroidales bacterium]|nr:Plug domain-containing protein [Bacteroidales bacterium]